MRQQVETPIRVLVKSVIAGATEVAVVIYQHVVQRKKPKRTVNVKNRGKFRFKLIIGGYLKNFAQLNQILPRVWCFLHVRFQLVSFLIAGGLISIINQPAAATGRHLPTNPGSRPEPFVQKIFIELLAIDINPPVLSIDDQFDKVRLRGGEVIGSNSRIEDFAEERGIGMTVQQVQGFVTVEPLRVSPVVNSDVERLFLVLNCKIGRTATEPDTDRLIDFPINN